MPSGTRAPLRPAHDHRVHVRKVLREEAAGVPERKVSRHHHMVRLHLTSVGRDPVRIPIDDSRLFEDVAASPGNVPASAFR